MKLVRQRDSYRFTAYKTGKPRFAARTWDSKAAMLNGCKTKFWHDTWSGRAYYFSWGECWYRVPYLINGRDNAPDLGFAPGQGDELEQFIIEGV